MRPRLAGGARQRLALSARFICAFVSLSVCFDALRVDGNSVLELRMIVSMPLYAWLSRSAEVVYFSQKHS